MRFIRLHRPVRVVPGLLLTFGLCLILAACSPGNPSGTPGASQGTLTGDVLAGPTCPVQQAENPCPPAPVPDRAVMIETADGHVVATATTDKMGHFSLTLAPGNYTLQVGAGTTPGTLRQTQPVHATVVAGQTVYVKIELDTGIR